MKKRFLSLQSIGSSILTILFFLLPIFFIPFVGISSDIAKMLLLQISVVVVLLIWLVSSLKNGTIAIPKSTILYTAFIIPLVMIISAFFSGATSVSMLGLGGETGTALAFTTFFILMFLGTIFFQEAKNIFYLYTLIAVSSLIFALIEFSRFIFGPSVFSFGYLTNNTANLLGRWNDMSLFFGFIAILSLTTLQLLKSHSFVRIMTYITLISSLVILAVTNFSLSWILVGVFSLVILVYSLMYKNNSATGEYKPKSPFPVRPLAVIIISVVFLLPGGAISNFLSNNLGISNVEVRPSWSATFDVVINSIKQDPVFGAGPNRFTNAWLQFKPLGINNTQFWNTDFNYGIGAIPSSPASLGILGTLAWLAFLLSFIYIGGKSLLITREDVLVKYMVTSSFLTALYFWTAAFFYVPNVVNMSLAFLLTGVFVALLIKEGNIKIWRISTQSSPRVGFISVLVLVVLIISSFVGEYFFIQRFSSVVTFGKGLVELNKGNVSNADAKVSNAIGKYKYDFYYRVLSDIKVAQMRAVISNSNKEKSKEKLRSQFQTLLGSAIGNARAAVGFDKSNYLNWIALGRVYESVEPLKISGAYKNADSAYKEALKLNPRGPAMYIILARAEIAHKDVDKAKEYIAKALELKNNYTEAIFLLSQIEAQAGNIKEAITQTERASLIAPNDIGVFFQLGFLRYSNKDYKGAVPALERAVKLNRVYSNAKYFLGLSYYKVGRNKDAIAQFKDVLTLNPDNKEVKAILKNLKAGKEPFYEFKALKKPPESRDKLPVKEKQ